MCIVYSYEKTHEVRANKADEFTAYKIYEITEAKDCLYSPFKSFSQGRCITQPGTAKAFNPWARWKAFGKCGTKVMLNKNKRLASNNREMNAWGFHCFLTKKEAERFMRYSFDNDRDNGNHRVVPVKVRKADIIIAGRENMEYGNSVQTITVKKLTISPARFKKALNAEKN